MISSDQGGIPRKSKHWSAFDIKVEVAQASYPMPPICAELTQGRILEMDMYVKAGGTGFNLILNINGVTSGSGNYDGALATFYPGAGASNVDSDNIIGTVTANRGTTWTARFWIDGDSYLCYRHESSQREGAIGPYFRRLHDGTTNVPMPLTEHSGIVYLASAGAIQPGSYFRGRFLD